MRDPSFRTNQLLPRGVSICLLLLVALLLSLASVSCTLKGASSSAGIRVGVAAAPGDTARESLIVREFNALSPENEFIWRNIQPGPTEWNFGPADQTMAFAAQNGLFTTVSHFIWDQAGGLGTPDWVKAINDPNQLRQVMRDHMATITTRYGSEINRWIVVNEPLAYGGTELYHNHFYAVLGPDYIAEAFRIAKEAAPNAELWLNEVGTEYDSAKADALVNLAAHLVSEGVPIDGVGLQGHLFVGVKGYLISANDPDYALVENTMRRIGDLGLKVAITELDAPVPAGQFDRLNVQAQRMAGMVKVCLAVPACDSVTFWGLDDAHSWINAFVLPNLDPLLFDALLQPKPAYFAVRDALSVGRP